VIEPNGGRVLSIQTTAIRLADATADATGLLRRPLAFDELVSAARSNAGLEDFGDAAFAAPMRRFLDACAAEADLGLIGRLATRWDAIRFLTNLLRLRAAEVRRPDILGETVARPIFITGVPRSGTTFLHRMMLADPANRAPLVYETIHPYPQTGARRDRRIARVARQLRAFELLAPEFRSLHPLQATSPQECSEITAHVFRSLRFDTTYHVPSYRTWMDTDPQSHLPAYMFHKRFLQHLQHQAGPSAPRPRWVLKCPDHLFALNAIRSVYPDARIVFVHRDPVKVLLSVTRLTEVLRRPFTRRLDQTEIGRQESRRWLEGTRRMIAVGDDAGVAEPVCHVHYLDLVSDPVATVEQVYAHFELLLPRPVTMLMQRYVEAQPNGGYGAHDYRFEDHGLDADAERAKFRPYMLRFGVAPELAPARRGGSKAAAPVSPVGT